jgi:hypothetical protein
LIGKKIYVSFHFRTSVLWHDATVAKFILVANL